MEKRQILKLLERVKYPGFSRDIVSFGMIGDIAISDQNIELILNISTNNADKINQVVAEIKSVLSKHFSVVNVKVDSKKNQTTTAASISGNETESTISNIKHIIAIASGKGGVGKSTVAANIAVSISNMGKNVGLLDLDIYGPSLPITFGVNEQPLMTQAKKLIPIEKDGIKLMSFGFISGNETPVIWRGPLVSRMTEQFFRDVEWGDLDFLIVDMPPGTGDTQLTFAQEIKVDGAIIISTPQEIALQDVKRGIKMFDKLKVNIIGLVDNMSHFIGDDGKKYAIFGENGVERTAKEFEKKFLGQIPINSDVGKYGDMGIPIVEKDPDHEITKIYLEFAEKIKQSYL